MAMSTMNIFVSFIVNDLEWLTSYDESQTGMNTENIDQSKACLLAHIGLVRHNGENSSSTFVIG
jgi:hypothetical protein